MDLVKTRYGATILVRVNPVTQMIKLMAFPSLGISWAWYFITMENDPTWRFSRTAGDRWTVATIGIFTVLFFLYFAAIQTRHRFVLAMGTKEGIHEPKSPRGGLPPVRVSGAPHTITLTVREVNWNGRRLYYVGEHESFFVTVSPKVAERSVAAFDAWVAAGRV